MLFHFKANTEESRKGSRVARLAVAYVFIVNDHHTSLRRTCQRNEWRPISTRDLIQVDVIKRF